jgi:hypothetical protein
VREIAELGDQAVQEKESELKKLQRKSRKWFSRSK